MSDADRPPAWAPPAPVPPPPPPPSPRSLPAAVPGGPPTVRAPRRRRVLVPLIVLAAVAVAAAPVIIIVVAPDGGSASAPCPDADGRSRELRRCLAESLAYVETPLVAGSGVLIDDGYIVTNAHVVDPYSTVRVAFDGGRSFSDVPVVGVDAFTDVAVVGPITSDRRTLSLDPVPDFDEAEEPDVFLVGFPGGIEGGDPEIALAGGLLSRLREDETFGLTYLQTDAAIAGGQSGGALVDENGTVLGISGLGFADEFALALSSDDVAASVARILDGLGDERRVIPTRDVAESVEASADLTANHPSRTMIIPADSTRREVEVKVTSTEDVAVSISTVWGDPIGVNGPGLELAERQAAEFNDPTLDDVDVLDEPEPGHLRFDAPSDEDIVVSVSRVDDDATVQLAADVPFVVFDDTTDGGPVDVGEPLRATVDGFTFEAIHPIELRVGDEVEITVRGGTSDAYFTLLEPQEIYDPEAGPDAEDGGGGLYDLDPQDTFEIDTTGTWYIVVGTWDRVVAGYELAVRDAT